MALTPEEQEKFKEHMRKLLEAVRGNHQELKIVCENTRELMKLACGKDFYDKK